MAASVSLDSRKSFVATPGVEPLRFCSGSLDLTKWGRHNQCMWDNDGNIELSFSSGDIRLDVESYESGNISFILTWPHSESMSIQMQLLKAGLPEKSDERYSDIIKHNRFPTFYRSELPKVYELLVTRYGIEDKDRIIERLARYGSFQFSELALCHDHWDRTPQRSSLYTDKTMLFKSPDLTLKVGGAFDGRVHFQLNTTREHSSVLKGRLMIAGVNTQNYVKERYEFSTDDSQEIRFVRFVLQKHYPIVDLQYAELVSRLTECGNWIEEERTRNIPLDKMQWRA